MAYIVFEAPTPGFPFRYQGQEYYFDERGLYFTREDRPGFVGLLRKHPKIEDGGKAPEDRSKYKRKNPLVEVPKWPEDIEAARIEKIKWMRPYFRTDHNGQSLMPKRLHDRDLDNYVNIMAHQTEKERFDFAQKIGG